MNRMIGWAVVVVVLALGFALPVLVVTGSGVGVADAKMAFVKELQLFEDVADKALAQGWRVVAIGLVDDYERGRIEGKYSRDGLSGEKPDYRVFGAEMATAVKFAYQRKLMEAGDYPITHEKVKGEMEKDERIRLLWEAADTLFEVAAARRVAADVDSDEGLKRLDKATEPKKRELVALLGKIRQ